MFREYHQLRGRSVATFDSPIALEAAAPGAGEAVPAGRGRGEIVLVVEDQAEVRYMTVRALQEAGFSTIEAADGLEALALLDGKQSTAAVALIDIALPNLDGLALARELERARPGMPVLFMTGYTSDEAMRNSVAGQGHPLIEKPFTSEVLVRRVRQSLDADPRRASST